MSFHRWRGRFDGGGEEFATVCPLAAGVARLTGVHFECRFTAGAIILKVEWRNLSPCARRPLPFYRRALLMSFHRRHGRFESAGGEFSTLYPLAAAVLRLAGVHF